MNSNHDSMIPRLLDAHEPELVSEWLAEQDQSNGRRDDAVSSAERREQSARFVRLLRDATRSGSLAAIDGPEWSEVRSLLTEVSRSRTRQGCTPFEVASFVLSFKKPLFARLREEVGQDAGRLADEIWTASSLLDALGLFTTDVFQKAREEVILRQQEEMLELSTPVVQLWDGILALPVIGTLDSARTQIVMESLLNRIVETRSQVAIVDITGVPTVDTLVAQHLLKTVTAARLMGADCIISGIRPSIAQTIVHLGVDLADITTRASLADAFVVALQRIKSPLAGAPGTPGEG